MKRILVWGIVFGVWCFSFWFVGVKTVDSVFADPQDLSAGDKRHRSDVESKVRAQTSAINKACESELVDKVDWSAFSGGDAEYRLSSVLCSDSLLALKQLCKDPVFKEAVKTRIKTVTCSFNSERKLQLANGNLELSIDLKSKNYLPFAMSWLKKNL